MPEDLKPTNKPQALQQGSNNRARSLFKWTMVGLFSILILIGLLFGLLQTQPVKDQIAQRISNTLSSAPGRTISVSGLEGLIPIRLKVRQIKLADSRGTWLTVENLVFSWSPLQLLGGAVNIDEISAVKIVLERLPESSTKAPKPKESKPFQLPERLPNLTVKALTVQGLHIGPDAFGDGGVFELRGNVLRAEDAAGLKAALRIARTDEAPASSVDLAVELGVEPSNLKIALDFSEATDGWVGRLAKLKEASPLSLSLHGNGPVSQWQGQLRTSAGTFGAIESAVELGVEEAIRVRLQGHYTLGSFPGASQLQAVAGTTIEFLLSGLFQPSKRVEIDRAIFTGKGPKLSFVGSYDFEDRQADSELHLAIDDLSRLQELLGTSLSGNLALRASVSGPLRQPHGDIELQLKEIEAKGYRVGVVESKLQLAPSGPVTPDFSGLQISFAGLAEDIVRLDGKPLPEKRLSWALNGRLETAKQLSIESLTIDGQHAHLKLDGQYNLADMKGALAAQLKVVHLAPLTKFAGQELPGSAQIELKVSGDGHSRSASGNIRGTLAAADGFPPAGRAILGDETTLSLDFNLQNGRQLTVPALKIASPVLQLNAQTAIDLAAKTLNADWHLTAPQLAPLSQAVGKTLSGSVEARGTIEGPFTAFKSTAIIAGNKVSIDALELHKLTLQADAAGLPKSPEGNLSIEVDKKTAKLKGSTDFSLKGRQAALKDLVLDGPGAMLKGDLSGDLDKKLYKGKITGQIRDLSALGRFLQQPMAGSGSVNLELMPGRRGQDLKLDVKGTGIAISFVKIQTLSVAAGLQNVFEAPTGSANAQIKDLEKADLKLKSLTFEASGGEGGARFQGAAAGHAIGSFDFRTGGLAVLKRDDRSLRLERFDGKFDKYSIRLYQPLNLRMASDQVTLDKLDIGFGKGRLEASSSMGQRAVRLAADFKDFPLEIVRTFKGPALTGSAQGGVRLSGDLAQPRGDVDLRLLNVRLDDPSHKNVPPLTLNASAKLQPGMLDLSADLQGLTEKPARVEAKVPARLSLRPYDFTVPKDGRLAGRLNFDADLAKLTTIFPLDGQALAGNAEANLDLQGSISAPELQGVVTLSNGLYENYTLGMVLKDWTVRVRAAGRRLTIEQFSANDGAGGNIQAGGTLEVDAGKRFPADLNLTLSRATLLHRSDVTSVFAGNLKIAGALNDLNVTGNLQVGPAEIQLPERLPPEMTELEVIEIHGDGESKTHPMRQRQPRSESPVKVALDVKMDLPRRIFVRGWGLDSEWEGKLTITGSAQQPTLVGSLSSVRGKLDFLSKRFDIKKGSITFYGSSPPMPDLNIVAESKVKDITARLTFSGPAANPEMNLSSEPALPSDEILARVLFGRTAASITPSQALQLAMLARSLTTGGGSQLDFMSRTRKFLGLDELEFSSSEEGLSKGTLGVGKYLMEGVYLNLQKGVGQGADKASVEVEITPNITVESEVGSDSSSGIGVNWKYDY